MAEAGRSRRMPRSTLAFGTRNEEEARAWLQDRLRTFSTVLFWSFAALIGFLFAMYTAYPQKEPHYQRLIYGVAAIAFAILAFLWRGLLVRGTRSQHLLYQIDLFITIGSGCVFGVVAPLAYDLQASSYTCLLYESFVVFTRALLIPSSARRTLIVSTLAFVPIVIGAVILAVIDANDRAGGGEGTLEIPGVAFVAGDVLYNAVAVLLSMRGSAIIYELRQNVTKAMQLGQYTLGARIGGGGMGEVFRATHALLRRETAIKLIRPDKVNDKDPRAAADILSKFEQEVRLTSLLTHPNTIAIFDYGRNPEGVLYYAMEYLDGLDLDRLVKNYGAQPADRVVNILSQVASALAEAHAERPPRSSLIHRDIKPANIILCERGGLPDFVKVLDFGLVKEITREGGDTATQTIQGTPEYLAPETVTGTVGPEVDIYALGAVGYYLLTRRHVFVGKNQIDVLRKHVEQAPTPPSELIEHPLPEGLEALLLRCLAKQPADRPTAAELVTALAALPRAGGGGDGDGGPHAWSTAKALRWWADFRRRNSAIATPDEPTQTMDIDVGARLGSTLEPRDRA